MFIYTVVNIGSEKLLKEEIAIKYPKLSFAYSRPGYVTFKDTTGTLNLNSKLNLVFARAYGISLGKVDKNNLENEIKKYSINKIHRFSFISGESSGENANTEDTVLDILEVKEGEYWLGMRIIHKYSWHIPGANPNIILPEDAPSRAYLKIAEALIWTNYNSKKNEIVLELGSAPGGASYALLEKGFKVYGVDNALMNESILKNPLFTNIKEPMQRVQDSDIPKPCHLLVSDVNVLPSLILGQLKRFISIRPSIHTVYYTLKIGDKISVKEILKHIETFKTFGFTEVHATQLPSNRSEILLYGKK